MNPLSFEILAIDGEARSGIITTPHSTIETPVFMPVGTLGTVKGIRFEELESPGLDARIILGNTYHLWLRPGPDTIRTMGGLHKFIGWQRSLLTDSGGFQVWSLGALRKISEEGTQFRSHIDGSLRFLSPEVSMEVQSALGSDIVMAFDECAPGDADETVARTSMELTARWASRSRQRFDELQIARMQADPEYSENTHKFPQALFGIVQGASHLNLRRESLARTEEIGFEGYAIGGLSVGEEKSVMYSVVEELAPAMPQEKPRYLMGVGTPEDLIQCVSRGIDMFDCVLPTRNGRTGQAFTSRGKLNVKNARWTTDERPLDEDCSCSVCRRHSRAYIRHLYVTGEMLASMLLTHHNLAFFLDSMRRVRQSIRSGVFTQFRQQYLEQLSLGV
ncbi:MAG: queuine tRNA-ribosyltransferase [Blastocatellia bacterium]|jgi:queuine tRNA-ribosyltransferase|nr:queuine tRNA-ribosyltransferase [Blastocatellia bacterium]